MAATRIGRCTRYDNCSKAANETPIYLPASGALACPECGGPLVILQYPSAPTHIGWLLAAAALIVAAISAAVWLDGRASSRARSVPLAARDSPVLSRTHAGAASVPAPAARTVLRLIGSNTIGARLAPDLARRFLDEYLRAQYVVVKPGPTANITYVEGVLAGAALPQRITVDARGTDAGFQALIAGHSDVVLANRPIRPGEIARLAALGDMTERQAEHVVGLNCIAAIVHPSNKIVGLTVEQLRRIYLGELSDWGQVGGTPGAIVRYLRSEQSGTFEVFRRLVLGPEDRITPNNISLAENHQVAQRVARDPAGIGLVALRGSGTNKLLHLAMPRAAQVAPTALNVGREDYPLCQRLYLYNAPALSASLASQFISFALSAAGQDTVQQAGFVALSAAPIISADTPQPPVPTNANARYRKLIEHAVAIPLDFRFRTGTALLDNKAWDDLERLSAMLRQPEYQSRSKILVGFADNAGKPDSNMLLSKQRAAVVKAELMARGITQVIAEGFGHAMPVASNDTPEGRERNRRVEIWLAK